MSVLALHGTEQGRIRESEKGGTENSGVRGTSMTNQYKRGRRGTFKSAHAEITTSIEHITAYKGTYYSCIQKVRTRNFHGHGSRSLCRENKSDLFIENTSGRGMDIA